MPPTLAAASVSVTPMSAAAPSAPPSAWDTDTKRRMTTEIRWKLESGQLTLTRTMEGTHMEATEYAFEMWRETHRKGDK
jgi:hypothetical protein